MTAPLPDAVARIARLAGTRPVQLWEKGLRFDFPLAADPEPVAPPDPLQVATAQMIDNQVSAAAEVQSRIRELEQSIKTHMTELAECFRTLDARQSAIAAALEENTRTLKLPVKPIKDTSGKVIGAQREAMK